MEDDRSCQMDEIEALASIYGDSLSIQPSSTGRSLELTLNGAILRVNMPPNYPSSAEPNFDILAPFLSRDQKDSLDLQLRDILSSLVGMPVIFSLSECIKEFIEGLQTCQVGVAPEPHIELVAKQEKKRSCVQCPAILTGDCIEDRKSVFQGHYAHVESLEQVQAVIAALTENRKIANATHNMYAYRIKQPGDGKMFLQDCDDDGETHAGGRMLHLLEILQCENVFVMVSRWYGGIQLGPDRFKHINNASRNVLEIAGIVKPASNKKSKKK